MPTDAESECAARAWIRGRTVGQAIEYPSTRERCAVAHHLEEIARVGGIDHLVATPRGLWVIETKHGLVPSSTAGRKMAN